jgi:hypothetical protein
MGHGGLHRLHDLQRPSPDLTKGGGAATPSDRKLGNLKMMEKNTSTVYIYIVFFKTNHWRDCYKHWFNQVINLYHHPWQLSMVSGWWL